jgi:5-methylcytosine-specific restriction protein B
MAELTGARFVRYLAPLLEALRSTDPTPMRPGEAIAWIKTRVTVDPNDLMATERANGQSTFENDVNWARFFLSKDGKIGNSRRGLWELTASGRSVPLTNEEMHAVYVRVHAADRSDSLSKTDVASAPMSPDDDPNLISYWFAGAMFENSADQLDRFIAEGIWQNDWTSGRLEPTVRSMQIGDAIAIKSTFVQRYDLPFDVGGRPVSAMRIKATGRGEDRQSGLGSPSEASRLVFLYVSPDASPSAL